MGDESREQRGRTMPISSEKFAWWSTAVENALSKCKLTQKQLAADLNETEASISRCITRKSPAYHVLIKVADHLKLPYPAILPESYEEADHLAVQRRLFRRDRQIEQIAAGVPRNDDSSQTAAVPSIDVFESQGPGKRAGKRAGKQRPRAH